MTSRLRSAAALLICTTLLSAAAGPAGAQVDRLPPGPPLPACRTGTEPPTSAPTALPDPGLASGCRAQSTRVESVARAVPGPLRTQPSPGYHHLGGTSRDDYSGILGRIAVRDTGVRDASLDFVAARFMAKGFQKDGAMAWLEAGWSETGWSASGKPHVYTYDTNSAAWSFYDQYQVADGDRIWIYLQSQPATEVGADPQWQAWLWWSDGWHLLTAQTLALATSTQIEQYVEVHADPKQTGAIAVPAVMVDNVQLREPTTGGLRYWRSDVHTSTSDGDAAGYCVTWTTQYDTWSAATC